MRVLSWVLSWVLTLGVLDFSDPVARVISTIDLTV
jgi:hypothetical protein